MSDVDGNDRFSRAQGIDSYKRRRRWGRVWRVLIGLVLIGIIGGASYLFGKQYIDAEKIPFDLPGLESEPPAVEQEEAAAPVEVQPASMSLLASGDVVLDGVATESGHRESGAYEFEHLFRQIMGELREYDVRIVAQEPAIAGASYGFGGEHPLNAPQDLGRAEEKAGFNVVLRANDHALDTGAEGIHNELVWWEDNLKNLPVLGIADEQPENNPTLANYVSNVYIFEKDGFKIAILNHTSNIEENSKGMVSLLTPEKIAADVTRARELGAEMIIACPHWGEENNSEVVDEQKEFARTYAEQGVDVILGNHPRVLQPVEVLEGPGGHKTVCFYSLGCLINGQSDANALGGFAELQLARNDQGVCEVTSARLRPTVVHRAQAEDFRTYLLSDYTDDLCYSSMDSWITVDEWNRRCEEALGDGYNAENMEFVVNLGGASPAQEPAEESSEKQSSKDDEDKKKDDESEATEEDEQYFDGYDGYGYDYGYGYDDYY